MPAVRGLEPGKRAALVVNEMQNAIANPAYIDTPLAGQVTARGIVARINTLTAAFRAAGAPVIFCTIAARTPDWDGFLVNCALAARIKRTGKLVAGTAGGAIHDDLVVEPSDVVSHRAHGMAPFTGTTLDATLRGYGIDTVVLSGVSTNIALPGAATEAVALGYNVVLAEDCAAGATPETHQMQITMHLPLLATIADAESVIASLRAAAPAQRDRPPAVLRDRYPRVLDEAASGRRRRRPPGHGGQAARPENDARAVPGAESRAARTVLAAASDSAISSLAWLKLVGGTCRGLAAGRTISSAAVAYRARSPSSRAPKIRVSAFTAASGALRGGRGRAEAPGPAVGRT